MLTVWKPRRSSIERVFDDFFNDLSIRDQYATSFSPNLDIKENEKQVEVKVELPGLEKENVSITYDKGYLNIEGERKSEVENKDDTFYSKEIRYGSFKRSIPINQNYIETDSINAKFENGILKITIEKSEKAKPKQIQVDVN